MLILVPMMLGVITLGVGPALPNDNAAATRMVDIGNGQTIELAPDEVLYTYRLADIPAQVSGTADPMVGAEYGIRTDPFSNQKMLYDSGTSTTTTANLSVPLGEHWEGYKVFTNVTDIAENRTWLNNYDFASESSWSFGTDYTEGAFSENTRVQYFSSSGTYQGQWGSYGTGNTQFRNPWGIAVSSSGNVYVADTGNHRIMVFSSTGTYVNSWGSFGKGHGQFNQPMGIAINSTGYVYVADHGNDRIQIFDSNGNYVGEWGSSGTGSGHFHGPVGVAVRNSNGYVYVTDMGNDRVQYFDAVGNYQGQWGGEGTGDTQFRAPTGIAINQNNGDVIVSDTSSCRVKRYSSTGVYQSNVGLISGTNGAGSNGYFRNPVGVAVNSTGTIFVADMGNDRIQYFNSAGTYQGRWGSDGTGNGNFRLVYGVAVSSSGTVYTTERHGTTRQSATWRGNTGVFQIGGYYHYDPDSNLYGFWYNPGDKAFVNQTIPANRGEVTWAGISLSYYADCRDWGTYMTGFFELFVSNGDPDSGGSYLWNIAFDGIANDNTWYSTGLIEVDPIALSFPNINIMAGLRVTNQEWYRSNDILPEGRLDNILVYIKAKATPSQVNLKMNGISVDDVVQGSPLYGRGTATYIPTTPWTHGSAYANFSWTPSFTPPAPNLDMNLEISVDVSVYARRYNVDTINDTETYLTGDNYVVANASDVQWETNFYAAVPGGYSQYYFFNITTPMNRDIYHVGQPVARLTNLTTGWSYGDPGDGFVNVSVYEITQTSQTGFWYFKGTSPNMISRIDVWDGLAWVTTDTFRANDDTRFRATLSPTYQNDVVTFTVYNPNGTVWSTLQATVDSSGYAISPFVNLDAYNASVGTWEVHAFVRDANSAPAVHNIGFFRRTFKLQHATGMFVKYPIGSETSWSVNVTYGEKVLLQMRVNDSDNGDLLPGGTMTYSWAAGSGVLGDMGTGEYSVTLDTSTLSSNGKFDVNLDWSKQYYDSLHRVFTINVIYTTDLFSPDAPGVDVPLGYNAELTLYYEDQMDQPITGALITCNWTLDTYTVTPVAGSPGYYTLSCATNNVPIGTYNVEIYASKDYFESRTIILSIQVRELHTSAIPSTSHLSLPVGYSTSFTITYTDTDHDQPITGASSSISCNWSEYHSSGDLNYTVVETSDPGVYEVTLYSKDLDQLKTYSVIFHVDKYGAQNHTFTVTVELRTHLTSYYLVNPINPTPYTSNITIHVMYYDVDTDSGIENGSVVGYNVLMRVTSPTLPGLVYSVQNGTTPGEYVIIIRADQWGDIGVKNLTLYANWTGPTVKYYNRTIDTSVKITSAPTDLYIGESPVTTPFGENVSFTIVYFDVGNATGVVNGTGPYKYNVHITVQVLTPGETLQQSDMVIAEIDYVNRPGEYRIEFNTSLLTGLIDVDLRIWVNWTAGALPYYENKTIQITVSTIYRQTTVSWTPLPITPYDELVNLSLTYYDVLSGDPVLNSSQLSITVSEPISYTLYYEGDATGEFRIEINTAAWTPGNHTFHINVVWSGKPFYQNRTQISIPITVRYRHTELVHGSYGAIQYDNNLTLLFTYNDLDDYTHIGMNGGTLTLNSSLTGHYWVKDNSDGTYTLTLSTSAFSSIGTFAISVSIAYGGARYCEDATDLFYLTVVQRRTQLTSEPPELAPYLTQANITLHYIDDNNSTGITGASVSASCTTSAETLQLGVNYWVDDLGNGYYRVRIATTALGTFGTYTITVTVGRSGVPFYLTRVRDVTVEVSRRPASLTVSQSPLNTPFLNNVTFEITVTDTLDGSPIALSKNVLILWHGTNSPIADNQYSLTGSNGVYEISINSTVLSSTLVTSHPISVKLFWGDTAPYYANVTATTAATITTRFTSGTVLSTPAAFYYFNISATLKYSDYLTGNPIAGATLTIKCENTTSYQSWLVDNGDGTYTVLVNTTTLSGLGTYVFYANFSWTGSPYYESVVNMQFVVTVNPVSTSLNFVLEEGATYYAGDIVHANVTFLSIVGNVGVENATITTDWTSRYGTSLNITELGNGVYQLDIATNGLNASLYSFNINASKYLHLNQTVLADILLAPIPVRIEMDMTPADPEWGDLITITANVTDARNGNPIDGAHVNVTIMEQVHELTNIGNGLYRIVIDTKSFDAGEHTIVITFQEDNYETRKKSFQIRVEKVPASLVAQVQPGIAVNGESVQIIADYLILSNGTSIDSGNVTFSWDGGFGQLSWSDAEHRYIGQLMVSGVLVGSHQVLVQASSTNYKSVSTLVTIDIREANTQLLAEGGFTVVDVISGDLLNLTVYLNNTDINTPVTGAAVTWSMDSLVGNFTETSPGYYSISLPTENLEIRAHILTVSSALAGYVPSSIQFTINVQKIPTIAIILGNAFVSQYYGGNVTFRLRYYDTHNNVGIENASATFTIENYTGILINEGGGNYSLTLNTSVISPGTLSHNLAVTFQKDKYDYAYNVVKLQVLPIPTRVEGDAVVDVPILDDYSQLFNFYDTLHGRYVTDANASAVWEFGTLSLRVLGNGSYVFGPNETGVDPLPLGTYRIRVSIARQNYVRSELEFYLTIRRIHTEIKYIAPPPPVYVSHVFYIWATYWDLDHSAGIANAINTTSQSFLSYSLEDSIDFGNGTYLFAFIPTQVMRYEIKITFDKPPNYDNASVVIVLFTEFTQEQLATAQTMQIAAFGVVALAMLAAAYIKVWKVPKTVRIINGLLRSLRKGKVPSPVKTPNRRETLMLMMNEDLEVLGIQKTLDDVALSTVDVSALDTEQLLQELAEIVGLTEKDLDTLRKDLDQMAPSDRAGFIQEVIKQERARRAKELAEAKAAKGEEAEAEERLTEEELEDLRMRLQRAGIPESEIETIIEQARNLSRAEIKTLLDQFGGTEE